MEDTYWNYDDDECSPCPFCGNEKLKMGSIRGSRRVYCAVCDAIGPKDRSLGYPKFGDEVIPFVVRAWNVRSDLEAIALQKKHIESGMLFKRKNRDIIYLISILTKGKLVTVECNNEIVAEFEISTCTIGDFEKLYNCEFIRE